jgi:hypothetical protein
MSKNFVRRNKSVRTPPKEKVFVPAHLSRFGLAEIHNPGGGVTFISCGDFHNALGKGSVRLAAKPKGFRRFLFLFEFTGTKAPAQTSQARYPYHEFPFGHHDTNRREMRKAFLILLVKNF